MKVTSPKNMSKSKGIVKLCHLGCKTWCLSSCQNPRVELHCILTQIQATWGRELCPHLWAPPTASKSVLLALSHWNLVEKSRHWIAPGICLQWVAPHYDKINHETMGHWFWCTQRNGHQLIWSLPQTDPEMPCICWWSDVHTRPWQALASPGQSIDICLFQVQAGNQFPLKVQWQMTHQIMTESNKENNKCTW